MPRNESPPTDYDRPTVPPATPPVITDRADANDAATLPEFDGDSDQPGRSPAEIVPGKSEPYAPARTPDEFPGGGGDTLKPGSTPVETPAVPGTAPAETPQPN
ncbi:hypothetical protein [Altericroceibacterium xinjiangense]|uniref:hypothetical protein n=1 Tax=Altericroceibacterium xinjiangense TaxID=762261 RepID=UPI000F7F5F42|nr:hypothetical protein [Altericroceibacterium xinjiangense]